MAKKFELTAEEFAALGEETWRPEFAPEPAHAEAKPRHNPRRASLVIILAGLLGGLTGPMLVINPPLALANLVAVAALFALWLIQAKPRVRVPVLAVHQKAVVVPKSFQSVPGLQRFGGPRAFRLREIESVTRVEDGKDALVLLRTSWGAGGIVDGSMGRGPMGSEELRRTLDAFCEALEKVGVKVTRGGPEALEAALADPSAPPSAAE